MKWHNVKPDILACPLADMIGGWSFIDIVEILRQTAEYPLVVMPESIRKKIMEHLNSQNVELGGLLVGSVVSHDDLNDGVVVIVIKDAVQSHDFDSTSVSLSMGAEVWQSANRACTNETFVIGWYHSHPNLGAYFSGVDRKTQKDFFNSSYNLGLVIDPIRGEEKWFVGEDSIELNLNNIRCISSDFI